MGKEFNLACADTGGQLYEHPGLAAAGRTGEIIKPLSAEEWIPCEGVQFNYVTGSSCARNRQAGEIAKQTAF